jgi:hypothetical protein
MAQIHAALASLLLPLGLQAQGAWYGPAIRADSLANTPIGKSGIQVSCRFRAAPGGMFRGARPFLIWSFKKRGYHAGTGGTVKVELQSDDGTPQHRPSGQVLATNVRRMALAVTSDVFYPRLEFDRAPVLTPGAFYHLVFSNPDPDPEGNFVSVNALFLKSSSPPAQPRFDDQDWAMLIRTMVNPAWTVRRTPGSAESFTPILEIYYAGGRSQGMGYMEFWMGAPRPVSGPAEVGEVFTVSGAPRKALAVSVRVRRLSGTAPLGPSLEQEDGKTLVAGACGNSPQDCTPTCSLGGCDWATFTFPAPQVLAPGRTYHLVLSAPASTRFEAFPMRKGSDKGFSEATVFTDGHAEFNDGRGWSGWEQWGQKGRTDADLQFFFRVGG